MSRITGLCSQKWRGLTELARDCLGCGLLPSKIITANLGNSDMSDAQPDVFVLATIFRLFLEELHYGYIID